MPYLVNHNAAWLMVITILTLLFLVDFYLLRKRVRLNKITIVLHYIVLFVGVNFVCLMYYLYSSDRGSAFLFGCVINIYLILSLLNTKFR